MRRLVVAVVVAVLPACPSEPPTHPASTLVPARVTRVVDGDTVHVDLRGDDVTIRLIGIDTPEVDGPFTEHECFGRAASAYTNDALHDRKVNLEFDVERTDRFDRTLAYLWIGGVLFNERIVRDGFASVVTFPPNVRYVDRLRAAERVARDADRGLWATCR